MVTQKGVKKKFNGKQWRLVCSVENCRKESRAHNCGLCVKHFSSTSNISCTVMPTQPLKCSMFTPMDSSDSRWKVEQDMYSTEKRHCVHSHMKWPMTCHHSINVFPDGDNTRKNISGESIGQDGRSSSKWEDFSESEQTATCPCSTRPQGNIVP